MYIRSVKLIALVSAVCVALAGLSGTADAAKKKKKRHREGLHYYSQSYKPTPAEFNHCRRDQIRYPTLDIRC